MKRVTRRTSITFILFMLIWISFTLCLRTDFKYFIYSWYVDENIQCPPCNGTMHLQLTQYPERLNLNHNNYSCHFEAAVKRLQSFQYDNGENENDSNYDNLTRRESISLQFESTDLTTSTCVWQTSILEGIKNGSVRPSAPIVFVSLGDSLDRNIVGTYLCNDFLGSSFGFESIKPRRLNDMKHILKKKDRYTWKSNIFPSMFNTKHPGDTFKMCIDTNKTIGFAFFKLFGMSYDCNNTGLLDREDSRQTNSTEDRIDRFLEFDVLSRVPKSSNIVFVVGSTLWDLSDGCNNELGISDAYQVKYQQGIKRIHEVLHRKVPSAPIYWRTAPPVSLAYDQKMIERGLGRTRSNIQSLNEILKSTVESQELGHVVDWWSLTQKQQPEQLDMSIQHDGRHYKGRPSLVYYDLFLSTVMIHHPWLLR